MTDARNMFEKAIKGLEEDEKDPKNRAIKEIIRVERTYYYASKNNPSRLKEIREIVSKYAAEEESDNADS